MLEAGEKPDLQREETESPKDKILGLGKIYFLGKEKELLRNICVPEKNYIPPFMKILEILEQNYNDPDFRLEQIDNDDEIKERTKARKTQRVLNKANTTFKKLLWCIRMKKAVELLQKGTNPQRVSNEVGFNAEEYFSSVFGKAFDMTPSDYKMKFLQMQIDNRLDPAEGLAQEIRDKINIILSFGEIDFLRRKINLLPNFCLQGDSNLSQLIQLLNVCKQNYHDPDFESEQAAKKTNCSTRTLFRRLERNANISLIELLTAIRMKHAIERLQEGSPINKVATDVGFSSHEYFDKVFKKTFNITPSKYQRQFLAMKGESPPAAK